jgi:hypothetical protein
MQGLMAWPGFFYAGPGLAFFRLAWPEISGQACPGATPGFYGIHFLCSIVPYLTNSKCKKINAKSNY